MGDRDAVLVRRLLSAAEVRARAHRMLHLCEEDRLSAWRVDHARLPAVADLVVETIRENYPSLQIPFHARWRHFVSRGQDHAEIYSKPGPAFGGIAERARAAFDLAIVSVLLDAGAGADWRYSRADGSELARSEGLAIASLDMFENGLFSSHPGYPRRADSSALISIGLADLNAGFRVSRTNPLVGIEGRVGLMNRLGQVVADRPDIFAIADSPRPGGLFDHLAGMATGGSLAATNILQALLEYLGPIWPSRLTLAGVALGDTWLHPALVENDVTNGLLPFHKLSQWLAYSLIEPLQWAGIEVTDIDALTGLPEYRNGGLFADMGVIALKNPADVRVPQAADSLLVVEWRALTVALLDVVARDVRNRLQMDAASLPLAKVLEGGTWAAGRKIARRCRADGAPPIMVVSDGTLF